MKKYLPDILAAALVLSTFTGCAAQSSTRTVNKSDTSVSMNTDTISDIFVSTQASLMTENEVQDISFSDQEYEKLLTFRFDGYEDMSISAYQEKTWELADKPEYCELLKRFAESEAFYERRDSDERASFLFYVLEPLTAERWKSREYGGYAKSDFPKRADNAMFEFIITLIILDRDRLTVGEYITARTGMTESLQNILKDRTQEQLQDEACMQTELDREIGSLTKWWGSEKLNIAVEYIYTPLSAPEPEHYREDVLQEQECRGYPNGTKEDYRSLFTLKTPDYQNMSIADFNSALLEWGNEDYERYERINCDTVYNDFSVPLAEEEHRFVSLSVNFSGMENAKYVQSCYTGRPEEAVSCGQYLPQKTYTDDDRSAWCDLYYQFSHKIADKETITVGERDRCVERMMAAVQEFWENSDIEILLKTEKPELVGKLQETAASCSTEKLEFTIAEDQVSFECMDERKID